MFMYTFSFNRASSLGAASSVMMLARVVAVLVPLMVYGIEEHPQCSLR